MLWLIVGVAVGLAALAAVGLSRGWRMATWAVALGLVAWLLAGTAAMVALPEPLPYSWQRAIQHRHALFTLALAIEAAVAAAALALAGWREARTRAAVAAWLVCGFSGVLIAIA